MSHESNQIVTIWKDVEQAVRRAHIKRKGVALDDMQSRIVKDALVLLTLAWYDLLTLSGYTWQPDKRWLTSLLSEDLASFVSLLKDADHLLIQELEKGDLTYSGFKHQLNETYPFAGTLLSPLKVLFVEWFDFRESSVFSSLHTALSFLGRLSIPRLSDLEDSAEQSYLLNEERLAEVKPTSAERSIIENWFPPLCDHLMNEMFEPRHGTGGVADSSKDLRSKYEALGSDPLISYLDMRLLDKVSCPRPRRPFNRTSKVVFVPKSVDKLRTICMEPTTLQWYQQGVMSAILHHIGGRHPLSRRIDLQRQELNRDLAWEGSMSGEFATVDLSSASDSVSWQLVKDWFGHTPIFKYLLATRSTRVRLPSGLEIKSRKYAPMGSALCFPVECIVFAAMIESSIKEYGDDPISSRYRVYGDDIIIETQYVPLLFERLTANGFIVNEAKSFFRQAPFIFRESCGGEFLDGADVTPVRISRRFSGVSVSEKRPERTLALIDLANECNTRLPSVRRYLIGKLNNLPIKCRVAFDDCGLGCLYSPNPTNHHLAAPTYNTDFQCYEWWCGSQSSALGPIKTVCEDIRLFEYLRVSQSRRRLLFPEDAIRVSVTTSPRTRWVSHPIVARLP